MSEVKKLKIGDTSYDVRDATALQNLTAAQEVQIETDGTYNGNVVEDGTVFTTEEGKFKALTISANYSAGTASSVASSYSSKCSCNGYENKGVAVLYQQFGTHIIVDDGTTQEDKEVSFAVTYLWYTNGHYFALDNSASKMYVSTNLDDWEELTSVSVASRNGAFCVVYHNGSYFFAYQNSSRNVIVKKVSDDFETASDVKSTYNYYAEFPELASDGTTLALFYGGGANSSFDKTTDDGATWTSSSLDTSRNIRGHVNLGGYIYILDLNNSKVLRTTDFSSFDVFDIANYSGSSQGFSIIKSFGDSLAVFGYYYGTFLYCSDLSTMTFSGAQILAAQQGTALDVNENGFVGGGYTVSDYYRVPITATRTYSLTDLTPTVTVDQTYDGTSANAQSGVAIAGAGFLKNVSTGTDSLCVSTVTNSLTGFTGFGIAIQGANYAVSIGLSAKVGYGAVSLGMEAQSGAGSNYAVCLGWKAKVAASCPYAIQIGTGTNSTANSLSVGLDSSKNYTLLTSDGTIPGPRMALQNAGAPTTATVGSVGQFYVDTTNQDAYICVSDASSTYTWKKITP